MDKGKIIELRNLFVSIICLAAEGPEFHTKLELMKAIIQEANKGYGICVSLLPKNPLHKDSTNSPHEPPGE